MSMLANPLYIFILVWATPLCVIMNIEIAGFSIESNDPIVIFLFLNCIILSLCYIILKLFFFRQKTG